MKNLTINELLYNRGLKETDRIKFVRHKDSRKKKIIGDKIFNNTSLYDLYKDPTTRNYFMRYQSEQKSPVFHDVDYIVTFIGEEGRLSRFIGVFKILSYETMKLDHINYIYKMEKVDGFENLEERIIIDWGKSTINWHQWSYNEKEIVELGTPLNYPQFTNYDDLILDRNQLETIFREEFQEWKKALKAVNCIYLITDRKSGKQYIGSTYGRDGIWGRWKGYADTIHNGNKKILEIINESPNYKYNFLYTILKVLPIDITDQEAIKYENLYKLKLGSKVYGLNAN